MNESNTEDEINRCILLEEFKLMPIEERYKAYGYVEMLMRFLDIENSFELDLVKKFNLNNSLVLQQGAIHYRIDVSWYMQASAIIIINFEFNLDSRTNS